MRGLLSVGDALHGLSGLRSACVKASSCKKRLRKGEEHETGEIQEGMSVFTIVINAVYDTLVPNKQRQKQSTFSNPPGDQ
jgi:hypothetical protein